MFVVEVWITTIQLTLCSSDLIYLAPSGVQKEVGLIHRDFLMETNMGI